MFQVCPDYFLATAVGSCPVSDPDLGTSALRTSIAPGFSPRVYSIFCKMYTKYIR